MKLIILIGVFGIAVYLLISKLRRSSFAVTVEDFFLANRKLTSTDFINSSVAYGYQVAALSLFASWGYLYGFWTVWVPAFWALGYYILSKFIEHGRLTNFLKKHGEKTVHGYLGAKYKSITLVKLAAICSILGLSGTAFFEADFTSNIISNSVLDTNGNFWYLFLFGFFVAIALGYILIGGLKTVVSTDSFQLSFGFILLNLFVIYTFIRAINNGYSYTGTILFFSCLALILVLNLIYPGFRNLFPANFKSRVSPTLFITFLIYLISSVYVIYSTGIVQSQESLQDFFSNQQFQKVLSLGALSMVSLLLANGLWQIVDISSWQRLAALNSEGITNREISKSVKFIGLYSSITWLIAIFFGMGLRYANSSVTDGWVALQEFTSLSAASSNIFDVIFIGLFILSMVVIMFSTLDSLLSAISYTTYFDIVSRNGKKDLRSARIFTVVYTVIFLLVYIIIRQKVSAADTILYTFYSFQLALFPTIISILRKRSVKSTTALVSILVGIVGAVIPLILNNDVINPYSASALFSVGGSTIAFWLIDRFTR